MLTATQNLLTSLDPLPYRARIRAVVDWARAAADRAEVCADLRTQGVDERLLALLAAEVTGDRDGLEAAVGDPHPSVRAAARIAAIGAGIEPGGLAGLSAMERRSVSHTLRSQYRPEIADRLVVELRREYDDDDEAAALLPGCGPETVRTLLPELEHAVRPERLLRRHAVLLLERASALLATADPIETDRIWALYGGAVVQCDPATVLDLIERHGPPDRLPGSIRAYGRLAAFDPGRVVRLLTAAGRKAWLSRTILTPGLLRRLSVLPVAELAPLARAVVGPGQLPAVLKAVAPSRRADLYDAALSEVDRKEWEPAFAVLDVLPAALRIAEAARVLGRDKVRDEAEVRRWSTYLSWPDASAALETGLRSGDALERAQSWRLLVQAARGSRDPQVVAELVERLGRLRNEQDPVRAAALDALAGAARLLSAPAAPGLTRLTTDAVDARDASAMTTRALASLAAETLQRHVDVPELRDWALLAIDLVSTRATVPVLRRFEPVLRRGQEGLVYEQLRGWVEAAVERGRYAPLFAVAVALGRRAWLVPALQEQLGRATHRDTLPWEATQAMRLWLADPRHRAQRVADVLDADPSAITLDTVWSIVASDRTDLLDQVLGRTPQGRFVKAGLAWVPPSAGRAERWLPRQRKAFLALQERVVDDAGREVWSRIAALRAAAGLLDLGYEVALRYTAAEDVRIQEAALAALAWSDRPDDALPVLLAQAGDDRARVALYAASRAARFVAPDRLPGLLGPLLTAPEGVQVTSRKEAARLLARYGSAGAIRTLLDAYGPGTHRDVRAAITSAARQRLDDPLSWTILDTAVNGSREERRAILATAPYTLAERFRARYATLILTCCRAADREVRTAAFAQVGSWVPWAPEAAALIADRLTDLRDPLDESTAAALAAVLTEPALLGTVDRLVDRTGRDEQGKKDLPARRRLEHIAYGLVEWSWRVPPGTDRTAVIAAARRLARTPELRAIAVVLLIGAHRGAELEEIADLCAGRPALAVQAADELQENAHRLPYHGRAVRKQAKRLAARGDLAGGLLAVALAGQGADAEWSKPWRKLVTRLRRHPDADVREAANDYDLTR